MSRFNHSLRMIKLWWDDMADSVYIVLIQVILLRTTISSTSGRPITLKWVGSLGPSTVKLRLSAVT